MEMSLKISFCVPVAAGIVSVFMGNHLILIKMLSRALPSIAIIPYYLTAIVEKFPVQVIPRYHNAPPPLMGKGRDHHLKRNFFRAEISKTKTA